MIIGVQSGDASTADAETSIGPNALIRSHTVIYAGTNIGSGFVTGHHATIREFCVIGSDVSIGTGSVVEHHVQIASGTRVHSLAFIPEFSVIEEDAWIGPGVFLTNAPYPKAEGAKESLLGPIIKREAKIGANATLLPGVVIGEKALVGAGAVVVRDVPPGAVVVGNPARVVNQIGALGIY